MIKSKLIEYALEYETKEFIKNDPIQFAHRYQNKNDVEIAGLFASMLAFGRREVFIKKLTELFNVMGNKPYDFIMNFDSHTDVFDNFVYRFVKGEDIKEVCKILNVLYKDGKTLESLFEYSYIQTNTIQGMLQGVVDYFYSRAEELTRGFCYLLPDPKKNSACKRLNMLLRWFVRDGAVDLGIWKFIAKSELIIPLDTHVARLSREIGFLKRNNNDFKSALEITNELKKIDPNDPVKLDFALFGYGVNN